MTTEHSTNLAALQESSLLTLAHHLRRWSASFGWPAWMLLLLAPAATGGELFTTLEMHLLSGFPLIFLAFGLRLWAKGFSREHAFVINGPYRYVRNPVELGALLGYAGAAMSLDIPLWYSLLVFVVGILYLSVVAMSYEKDLQEKHGITYLRYKLRVRKWIPSKLPGTNNQKRDYSLARAISEETKVLYWTLAYFLILAMRLRLGSVWNVLENGSLN